MPPPDPPPHKTPLIALSEQALASELDGYPAMLREQVVAVCLADDGRFCRIYRKAT